MLRFFLTTLTAALCLWTNAQNSKDWKGLQSAITLIVTNDNGRNGYYDQKNIASTMGQVAEAIDPEAVLALGDVFHYNGVQSVNDPLWLSNFESIYSHPELMIDWFPVCGNHEYRGNTQAIMDYSAISRRWEMPSKFYSKTFKEDGTTIKIIFLDTTPLIDKYHYDPEDYPEADKESIDTQLEWLAEELENTTEDWTVVVGHHPIFADTDKSESERKDMQQRVDRILRCHKVDMYICGHIHNFQHIKPKNSDIDYIVNSSASLSRRKVGYIEGTVFVSGEPGFSVIGASPQRLVLSMIDKDGNIIHQIERKK